MTREEIQQTLDAYAKDTQSNGEYVCTNQCELLIDSIYNDFKNRICNNCKWFNKVNDRDIGICGNGKCEDIDELGQYVVRSAFGCNAWEVH